METSRTYGDSCAVALALDAVGGRWALLVIRELLLGPKRFSDLRKGLPNAKPSVISQRLRELEDRGVVQRRRLGPPASTGVYELTAVGRELEPVVIALGHWGRRLPPNPDAPYSVDSLVLALKWRLGPDDTRGLEGNYGLHLADDRFRIEVADGTIGIQRGHATAPDAVIETEPATLRAVTFDGRDLDDAIRSGEIHIEGDEELAGKFLSVYTRPA